MKRYTSVLQTNQLIQLAQQVLNDSDKRHVASLMRAHLSGSTPDWNRQELIDFLAARNGNTPPDQILSNIAEAQRRKVTATQQQPKRDGGGVMLKFIDLSKQSQPAQDPRAAVFIDCPVCGKQFAVPVAQKDSAYCSKQCLQAATQQAANDEAAMLVFMRQIPQFYPHPANFQTLGNELERLGKTKVTAADILDAYQNLDRQGSLLRRLSDADVREMNSSELEKRIAIDPACGGADLAKAKEGQSRGEFQVDQTNKTRLLPFRSDGSTSRTGREGGL
jgi:endogenous inhibitor of DNA gyrase (YacG/DUF329 family)